jgi:hypothetical protein
MINASHSMQDILMFLITFFVIMLAFSCGVSYMFNYLTDGTGSSTGGVFTYFFWVLLQVGSLPHGGDRLLLLGPSPGRLHGPTCLLSQEGTGSSTSNVFTYFFWVLLQVGFMVLHAYYLRTEQVPAPAVSSPTSSGSFSR